MTIQMIQTDRRTIEAYVGALVVARMVELHAGSWSVFMESCPDQAVGQNMTETDARQLLAELAETHGVN